MFWSSIIYSQVNVQINVYEVSTSIGDCDGFFGGDSDPVWWFDGGDIPLFDCNTHSTSCNGCTQNISIDLLDGVPLFCPPTITYDFSATEDDGFIPCVAGLFLPIQDGGGSAGQTLEIVNSNTVIFNGTTLSMNGGTTLDLGPTCYNWGGGCPGTWCYSATLTMTGTFPDENDVPCDAVPLGTIPFAGSLGNENNFIYQNFCGTADAEANGWTSDYGVWFSFETGNDVGSQITIELEPQGGAFAGDLDINAAIFTEDGCTNLTQFPYEDNLLDLDGIPPFDETVFLNCPEPNTTYYLLVSGVENPIDFLELFDEEHGFFGIGIYDDGSTQAADFICDAEYMGTPLPGNSITTNVNLQSNICASNLMSPTTNDPIPAFNWEQDNGDKRGVWYEITAPPSGSVNININSTASTLNIFDPNDLDVYVALFTTLDDVCDPTFDAGQLTLIEEQHSNFAPCGLEPPGEDASYDESMDVHCLTEGQSYWIFIDGNENLFLAFPLPQNGNQGFFTITVSDLEEPPTINDAICGAIALDGGVQMSPGQTIVLNNQSNRCADNFFEPFTIVAPCNDSPDFTNEQGVWYSFIAPPSGAVNIWAENLFTNDYCPFPIPLYEDAITLELAVFELDAPVDCSCGDFACNPVYNLICAEREEVDDLLLGGITPEDVFSDEHMFVDCLVPGQLYYIMVDGSSQSTFVTDPSLVEGSFDLTIEAVNQATPTFNDTPCEAVALGPLAGTSASYNNYCATTDPTDPIILDPLGNPVDHHQTVWFTFEATSTSAIVEAINDSDDIDIQLGVYESADGTCTGDMLELQADYDPVFLDEEVEQVYCLEPGSIYYIMVDGVELINIGGILDFLTQGDFQIIITPEAASVSGDNDLICNAYSFPGDPFTAGPQTLIEEQNLCANSIGDSIPTCFTPDHTVWFQFDTPTGASGYAVDILVTSTTDLFDLLTPPFNLPDFLDPQVTVFGSSNDNCDGDLFEVACSYDPLSLEIFPDAGFSELLEVQCLEPNSTYYIMIDGSFEALQQGFFNITLSENTSINPAADNDECVNATDLGTVPLNGTIPAGTDYSNYCADVETGEVIPNDYSIDQTVWFTFTAPDDGTNDLSNLTLNLLDDPNANGDGINIQATLYTTDSDCSGIFTEIESGSGGANGESLNLNCLIPGQEYYLQVDGTDIDPEGYFQIEIIDNGSSMTTPNDNICDATDLGTVPNNGTLSDGTVYTNSCATIETDEPAPGFSGDGIDQTVWFTFTPPVSGNVTINAFSAAGLSIDLQLAVYYSADGTCAATQMVPILDAWNAISLDESLTVPCLDPNVTYYLQVDGSSIIEANQSGNFIIEIEDDSGASVAPVNNDICNATDFGTIINTETLTNETNECANLELNEPGLFNYAQQTVWYQFIVPASGQIDINVTPNNPVNLLPEIYLFSTDGTSCDFADLLLTTSSTTGALTTSCIIPGNTYFIQIDGQIPASSGLFDISITDLLPNYAAVEPSNNECFGATSLTVQDESCFIGDGTWDIENYGQPTVSLDDAYVQSCNPNGNCGDTWYSFTLPFSGTVLIEGEDDNGSVLGTDSDLTVIAYTGNCVDGLIALDCEMGGTSADISYEVEAEPGSTVYLQVFNGGGDDHGESFALCISEQCGADNCEFAIEMQADSVYCWNTASATGENITGGVDQGYLECGDGSNPEHSIYFSFTSECNGGSATVSLLDVVYEDGNPFYFPCSSILGIETPLDGFAMTVFADATPCDNQEDDLIYCQVFSGCDHSPNNNNFSFEFENLNPFTDYIIQLDGGIFSPIDGEIGGNVQGSIVIEFEPTPEIDSMIIIDSILCFGDLANVTAEVNEEAYPYTFNWDNTAFDSIYMNVTPGWHYLTVTGNNGCEAVDSIFVPEPLELFASISLDSILLCNGDSTSATSSGIGGTVLADYLYEWSTIPPQTTATAISLFVGTYTVTITDDNGCTATENITIAEPPAIEPTITLIQDVSCNGGSDGSAEASAIGGTIAVDYQYAWSTTPAQNTAIASNLIAGIYTVTITDDNFCNDTISITINEPEILVPAVTLVQDVSCNGGADGSAEASATGGTIATDYQYEWSTIPVQNTAIATNLTAGTYTVTITDDNGCDDTIFIDINEPTAIVPMTAVLQDVSCNGGSDGSAEASATGGTVALDYQYAWSTTPVQNTAIATNLAAGTYTVTVTDDNSCTMTAEVDITEPIILVPAVTLIQDVSCNGGSDGSAEASATGGTIAVDYQYEWSTLPVQNTVIATGLSAGLYTVTITDDNNCLDSINITINEPILLVPAVTLIQDVSCSGGSDGSGEASATGGTIAADYQYVWSTTPAQNTAIATSLSAGLYTVTITDDNGCLDSINITINEPTLLVPAVTLIQDVSCNGGADGSAEASAIGGTIAVDYQYVWSTTPAQTTAIATGLSVGLYTVTITDDNGCSDNINITINEPTILVPAVTLIQDVSCNSGADGSAEASAIGGTIAVDYQYTWSTTPTQTTAIATGLSIGLYTVTITDDNGCLDSVNITINEPAAIIPTITTLQDVSCNGGADGSAEASAIGGTIAIDYQYAWSTTPVQTTAIATGLSAGLYTVIVTDDNACTATEEVTITEPTILVPVVTLIQDVSCNGGADGSAEASAIGGTIATDYQYEWSTLPVQTTAIATGLSAGLYTVTITDDNGCLGSINITINEPAILVPVVTLIQNVSCNGGPNGSAEASAIGGTIALDYQYEWSTTPIQTTAIATGLSAGLYTITITDDNGCSDNINITINEPTLLVPAVVVLQAVTCNGGSDGSAEASAIGGTIALDYQYEWSTTPVQNTAIATGLSVGLYTVTITDDNMCSDSINVTITEPLAVTAIDVITGVTCFGGNDGAIELFPIGVVPFTYTWSIGGGNPNTLLVGGTYDVTITDGNGCTFAESYTVVEPADIMVNLTTATATSCTDTSDGSLAINITGGTGAFSYNWTGDAIGQGPVANNLSSGTYTVTVTDDNNCEATAEFVVPSPPILTVSLIGVTPVNCLACDGRADIFTDGGTPPYSYSWSNGSTDMNPIDLCEGTSSVTVTDFNNCTAILTNVDVDSINLLVVDNVVTADAACNGEDTGTAIVTPINGKEPYLYEWDAAANLQTTATATDLFAGTYSVTITDDNGCTTETTATVGEPTPLVMELLSEDAACYGEESGTIIIDTISGGTGDNYLFAIDDINLDFSPDTIYNFLVGGWHTVYVKDGICIDSAEIFVNQPPELLIDAFPLDTTISLGESVELLAIPNQANSTVSWTPGGTLSCDDCFDPISSPTSDIEYTVLATNMATGCDTAITVIVRIDKDRNIFIPNAFTPNGDGYNDFLNIYSDGSVAVIRSLRVFDRWGELVYQNIGFQPNMLNEGWDGTFNGKKMQTGVFVYMAEIEFVDGVVQIFKGDVTLVR
ncbi:MAG: gliding motility-associated-like protein [Maribacter sp.]|jgi:gliding motility-associated-like protein